jgi:CheY-like chemotaxis protein
MDSATIAQAFEPFFSTKGLHGTGLGLSMVQGFARQSGGEVAIASVPGQGTCVEIRLPAAAAARATEPARLPPPQVERVLVVDDAADVLVVLGAFLRSAGFDVVKVNGGDAALALLAAGDRFAALVTDYAMPGMNGVDLIVQARDMQPGLAGLLISGYTELANATTLPGGVELLSKPFHREHVVAAVRRAIAAGHAEDPRSPAAAKRKLAEQR